MINNKKEPDVKYKNQLSYSRKNPNRGSWGYGISRGIKEIVRGISRGDQEKIIWNFHGSFFLALEFLRDLGNRIVWNIQALSFVLSGISRDHVKEYEKFCGSFHKSISSTPPAVWCFSGIAHSKVCLHHGAADK